MRTLIIISLLFCNLCADFPLENQTWVLMNGGNINIVKSMFDFDPLKVIIVMFKKNNLAKVTYANLSNKYFRSTSEAMDFILSEFGKNRFNVSESEKIYKASYQPFPDDEFSCMEGLRNLSKTGVYQKFSVNKKEMGISALSQTLWFDKEPECFAVRGFIHGIDTKKTSCQNGWCANDLAGSTNDPRENDVCNQALGVCQNFATNYEKRQSKSMFWNLHVFPRVIWNPRHHITGRIIVEDSYEDYEMDSLRNDAIANKGDELKKKFLNPQFSQDESVIFSAQFGIPEGLSPSQIIELNFDLKGSDEKTSYYHSPTRAYRVSSFSAISEIKKAILLPFADENNFEWVENLDMNCPGWQSSDKRIGERAFNIVGDLSVSYGENIPQNVIDPTWFEYEQKIIEGPDGEVKTVWERKMKGKLDGQTAIVRNPDFPYQDYWWKGCPDMPADSRVPYTKKQIKSVLYTNIPKCDPSKFHNYNIIYRYFGYYVFNSKQDPEESKLALKRSNQAMAFANKFGTSRAPAARECSDSPIDVVANKFFGIN